MIELIDLSYPMTEMLVYLAVPLVTLGSGFIVGVHIGTGLGSDESDVERVEIVRERSAEDSGFAFGDDREPGIVKRDKTE